MIKAIFLDFDGTLSDAHKIAHDSVKETLKEFGKKFDEKKIDGALGNKMGKILEILKVDMQNLQKFRRAFYKKFTKKALDGKIKRCTDMRPLIKLSKKYPLIVISNSESKFIKASIKKLKLKGIFSGVYGAEKFKSKDTLLKKLFKKMKLNPSEAIYIGDRFSDVDYAKSAHCISIAIHNECAWSSLAQIKKEKPDYIIKNFYELENVLKKLNPKPL